MKNARVIHLHDPAAGVFDWLPAGIVQTTGNGF